MTLRTVLILSALLFWMASCATAHEGDLFDSYASRAFEQRHIDERYRREFMFGFRAGLKSVVVKRYLNEPDSAADTPQHEMDACRSIVELSFSDEHQDQAGSCGAGIARQLVLQNDLDLGNLGYSRYSGAARLGARRNYEPVPLSYFLSIDGEQVAIRNFDSSYFALQVGDCLMIEGYLSGEGRYAGGYATYTREVVVGRAQKVETARCGD